MSSAEAQVDRLALLKRRLNRLWWFSPERLWLLSIALQRRGHWALAFWIKQLNTLLYKNSLAPGATVSPDVRLGHNGMGVVVTRNVVVGQRVKIWHNVTLSAGRPARDRSGSPVANANHGAGRGEEAPGSSGSRPKIILEDGVTIGANAVVIGPRGRTIRVGRGAHVGAGTVVTEDVPAGAMIVSAPARILTKGEAAEHAGEELSAS